MEMETLAICGLCFKISAISKYEIPPESLVMLRALNLEKINLGQNEGSLVCSSCEKKVKNVFDFKMRCLEVERNRVSSKVKLVGDKKLSEVQNECRLCNNIMSSNSGVILLDALKENNIIEQFQHCIWKIDLDATDNSLICEPCQISLCEFSNFFLSCPIGKFEESKKTSQLLQSRDHQEQESNNFNEIDTKPLDSSLICTDFYENDTVKVKIEINDNDICKESKITDSVKKKEIINEDHCYALKITVKTGNSTDFYDSESMKGKINEKIMNECNIASDVNDITNKDMKEKVASENLELQLKNEEIDIKSEPEEFMSEMPGIKGTSEQNTFRKSFQTTDVDGDGIKMDRCQNCTYQTITTYSSKDHIQSPTNLVALKIQKCQQCNNQIKYKVNVEAHIEKHMLIHKNAEEAEMHKCRKCTYQSIYKKKLKKHMLIHKNSDEVGMYKCQECTSQSKNKYYFKRHILTHKNADEVEMHKCRNCPYQSTNKYYLKNHMLIHKNSDEVEMHKCQKCTYQSKYKPHLKKHMLIHNNPDEVEMYKCQKCTYQSKRKYCLKIHMLIHKNADEVEIHKCQKCTYQSKYKNGLTKHMLFHKNFDEVEMHKCQKCIFKSKYKGALKKHMVVHKNTDEVEMHKCQKCTFQSKHKFSLKTHMLTHKNAEEVKMHKCQRCTFQSKHKHSLKTHMLLHKNPDEVGA